MFPTMLSSSRLKVPTFWLTTNMFKIGGPCTLQKSRIFPHFFLHKRQFVYCFFSFFKFSQADAMQNKLNMS